MTDLFGHEAPAPEPLRKETILGDVLDHAARSSGGWPSEAVVYRLEAVADTHVLITGAVPVGHKKDGRPKFDRKGREYKAVITNAEYQALWEPRP